jgi:hypothetical protein
MLEAAQKTDIDSSQVDRVLHAARTWRHRLQSEAEQTSAIGALVDRVELKSGATPFRWIGLGLGFECFLAASDFSH